MLNQMQNLSKTQIEVLSREYVEEFCSADAITDIFINKDKATVFFTVEDIPHVITLMMETLVKYKKQLIMDRFY